MTLPTVFAELLGLRTLDGSIACLCDQLCLAAGMGPRFCKRRYDEAKQDLIDFRDFGLSRGMCLPAIELVEDRCDRRGLPIIRIRASLPPRPDHANGGGKRPKP